MSSYELIVPGLLTYVLDENVELRQAAAYGLSLCATRGTKDAFRPFLDEV